MALTIDNMASRYHCLPTEVLERATTFDLYVIDVSAKWERHSNSVASGQTAKERSPPSESEMLKMLNEVKEKKK